ncbi:MAG TPA: ABC transporter substrate-binding protein [Holophaga sp.]|nr:ABC transporter substrate-binding protein [Holophaga sp.]
MLKTSAMVLCMMLAAPGGQAQAPVLEADSGVVPPARILPIPDRRQDPEVLYVSDYDRDVAEIAKQARELGFKGVLLGCDGWDSPKLPELAGQALEGGLYTNHFIEDDPSPNVRAFVKGYRARYGRMPDALAALGYDAAVLLFDAVQRAGSEDGAAIRDALASADLDVATGHLRFGPTRDPIKSAVVCEIKDGQVVYRATVEP